MPNLAAQLVHSTAHLGTARGPLFIEFLTKCKTSAGTDDYYSYPDLKQRSTALALPPSST